MRLSARQIGLLSIVVLLAGSIIAYWRLRPAPANSINAVTPQPTLQATPTPAQGPVWQYNTAKLGQPASSPVWLDGCLTQFFERTRLQMCAESGNLITTSLALEWRATLPADLLRLPASPFRATLDAPSRTTPLAPIPLTLNIPGYDGPAEVRLYDSRQTPIGIWPAQVRNGSATIQINGRGALGPHAALALIEGKIAGARSKLLVLEAETTIQTGQPRFDELYPRVRTFMEQAVLSYRLGNTIVRGYRSPDNPLLWLRDHTYQSRGFRYFERDMTSLIDAFRRAQRPDGSFPDFLDNPELYVTAGRKQVEADLEYLFVQAVYEAWQTTGDDAWLKSNLESMRRGIRYSMSDPLRWDAEKRLIKRPYTIDTWDFEYGPSATDPTTGRPAPRHWIDDRTIWGIFHGDNTGLAASLELLARIEEHLGDPKAAEHWRGEAAGVISRLRKLSWNGSFYRHFVPLKPLEVPGVDVETQLSLSNAYALNRGVLRQSQGRQIVEEYHQRGLKRGTVFAEWYSIDPPFPPGSYGMGGGKGEQPGEYVNGGIMPLVGGELARGAFRYGAEAYAFDILHRYYFLISSTNASYLWYYPAGNPGISSADTLPYDGWGSSAMLGALIEGAAGVEDRGALYRTITLSPRWAATPDIREALVVVRYAASEAYIAYRWQRGERTMTMDFTGSGEQSTLRLLLPESTTITTVTLNGRPQSYEIQDVFGSRYLIVETSGDGVLVVQW